MYTGSEIKTHLRFLVRPGTVPVRLPILQCLTPNTRGTSNSPDDEHNGSTLTSYPPFSLPPLACLSWRILMTLPVNFRPRIHNSGITGWSGCQALDNIYSKCLLTQMTSRPENNKRYNIYIFKVFHNICHEPFGAVCDDDKFGEKTCSPYRLSFPCANKPTFLSDTGFLIMLSGYNSETRLNLPTISKEFQSFIWKTSSGTCTLDP